MSTSEAKPKTGATPREANLAPLSVLVVDDDPGIRSKLVMCLEDDGHDVTAVSGASEAVEATTEEAFDVIIFGSASPRRLRDGHYPRSRGASAAC